MTHSVHAAVSGNRHEALAIYLDVFRWVAAFAVLLAHVRHLILVDLKYAVQPSLAVKVFYLVTGFGHEAVIIFFVLSGYLVGGTTLQKWQRSGVDLGGYFAARISRIYTVLLPALLLGVLLDQVGLTWLDASRIYADPASYRTVSMPEPIGARLTPSNLAGNLFMLQGIAVPVLGSNGPLWSLSWEWWYYCLFAFALVPMYRRDVLGVFCGSLVLAGLLLLPEKLLLWGLIWLLGLVVHRATQWGFRLPWPLVWALLLAGALLASRLGHNVNNVDAPESMATAFGRDLLVALPFAALLVSLHGAKVKRPGMGGLHATLANFSYTTYLCHFPIFLFITSAMHDVAGLKFHVQPDALGIIYVVALSLLTYGVCWGIAWATERHTPDIRQRLDGWFRRDSI